MKIAVIITGAMRSFERCLPNLNWFVFRHFPEAKFYVATHDDEDAIKAALLGPRLHRMEKFVQPEMIAPEGCPAHWVQGQPYMHEPYAISVPPSHVMGQLWINQKGWELYRDTGEEADLIVRCRPDLWFHSFDCPRWKNWNEHTLATPWWGRFGGLNDRFGLLRPLAADSYFRTFENIPFLVKKGCPLHPESLLKCAVDLDGSDHIDDLLAEFSTLRKSGEMRPPEITGIDIAHLSIRR